MKSFFVLFIWILLSNTAAGQCDNSLIGKWKVIAVNNGATYINFKTDSIHFSSAMDFTYRRDSLKQVVLAFQKDMYKDALLHFKNDSSLHARMLGEDTDNIRYCFQKLTNQIQIISEESSGKKIVTKRTAAIKNGLLYMTISPPEMKDYVFEIIFEKIAAQ